MRIPRIFTRHRLEADQITELDSDASQHVFKVLRLRPGDSLVLFDGAGGEYSGRLLEAGGKGARVELQSVEFPDRESPIHTTLVMPILRSKKMDFAIQKATELGVSAIRTFFADQGLVRLTKGRLRTRAAHWQRIIEGACEQSGRTRLPQILSFDNLGAAVEDVPADAVRVAFIPGGGALRPLEPLTVPVFLITGPEGGFSEQELNILRQAEFEKVSLGPRILRTETAPMAALTVLQFLGKGLGP